MEIISRTAFGESFKIALPTSTPDISFSKIHVLSTKFCRRLPFLIEGGVPFSFMTTGALFRFFRVEATVCQDPASLSSISSSSESNGVASISRSNEGTICSPLSGWGFPRSRQRGLDRRPLRLLRFRNQGPQSLDLKAHRLQS